MPVHVYACNSYPKNVLEESLKLPIGIKALGSLRFLPIVKMINGEKKSKKLLQQAKAKDAVLKQKLWLCEKHNGGHIYRSKMIGQPDNEWLFVKNLPIWQLSAKSYLS